MALRHLQLLVWHQDRIVCYIGITTLCVLTVQFLSSRIVYAGSNAS